MHKTVVINAVGLTPALIGPRTPRLRAFADAGAMASVGSVLPAVTTTVQSTYLTGTWPSDHGIVGNGWYFRDECEVKFWKQSNKLVQRPKIWDAARAIDPSFTCANLFWWYNMYSSADVAVTPRPMYPADGRKVPDVWTHPASLRESLQKQLGQFPLFKFWGPATSVDATRWIADSALRVDEQFDPTLTLIYLPHLDYSMQRLGPDPLANARDLQDLDTVCGTLIDHYHAKDASVVILSEYGLTPVSRPIHLNRILRENGLIAVRAEMGRELLDPGASAAFAVVDHQIAHVYVNDPHRLADVGRILSQTPGIERLLDQEGKRSAHLNHERSGEFVVVAEADAWFNYYYWLDDAQAPDFAHTVDIHRKPGYDPVELFYDTTLMSPQAKAAWILLRRKLGFRGLMSVISTDASLVRGSHGREAASTDSGPCLLTSAPRLLTTPTVAPTEVFSLLLAHLIDDH
jgi:predicted AlkP superfamily pyrophosphatase or phosphodiesterase